MFSGSCSVFSLIPIVSLGPATFGSISDELSTAALEDALVGLMPTDNEAAMFGSAEALALTLLLAGAGCPRLSRLALLRVLTRLDEDSNEGEEVCNCPELTGVAIKVGVTSLRVISATVVLARSRLRGRLLGRIRVRNKLGRIAGVNEDCAGRVKVILDASNNAHV